MTTSTSRNETRIVADHGLPTIVVTREFEAPPDRVFRAYTDPELVVQWLGPRRMTMAVEEYDARTHGSYRYRHIDEDGTEHGFHGTVHEVRQDARIVQTFTWDGEPDGVSLDVAVFEDLGGRTRVTTASLVDSLEARDAILVSGMEVGLTQGYERLDDLLAAQP